MNLYRNRCNPHTLKRKMDLELELTEQKQPLLLEELEQKRNMLLMPMKKSAKINIHDFVTYRSQKRKLQEIETKIEETYHSVHEFLEKTKYLKSDSVASLIVVANNSQTPCNEIFTKTMDHCVKCETMYECEPTLYLNICPCCKFTKRLLIMAEDRQSEVICFKNQELPLLLSNYPEQIASRQTQDVEAPILETNAKDERNLAERRKAYREYVIQWEEHAPIIPEFVKMKLYERFNHIHMLNSLKCRPSAVANVLKEQGAGMIPYQMYAMKITKEFNGEEIPVLTLELVERCCERFHQLSLAALSQDKIGKLPSVEILTHFFLRAEGRDDLARLFFTHKDYGPLRVTELKLRTLVDICAKKFPGWDKVPRIG